MNLGSDDNRWGFFGRVWVVFLAVGRKKQMKWAVWSPTSERAPVGWNAGSSKKLWNQTACTSPHTHPPSSLRFWTTEDVICHISKVGEEARDCSPFRNVGILSLQRNISSRAYYYISLRQYLKQRVSSVSPCLSLVRPYGEIILLNDGWGWLI